VAASLGVEPALRLHHGFHVLNSKTRRDRR